MRGLVPLAKSVRDWFVANVREPELNQIQLLARSHPLRTFGAAERCFLERHGVGIVLSTFRFSAPTPQVRTDTSEVRLSRI